MRRSLPCHSEDAAAIVPEAGAGGKLRREGGAKVAVKSRCQTTSNCPLGKTPRGENTSSATW
jgi:hypothetical protein